MMNKMRGFLVLLMVILLGFTTSCYDNTDCAHSYSDTLSIQFYTITEEGTQSTSPDLERITALNASIALYTKVESGSVPSRFNFPVNRNSDTTTFIFHQAEVTDTLQVLVKKNVFLVNPECGLAYIINIDTAYSSFDSLSIPNKGLRYYRSVGNENMNNLEIFH